MTNKILTQSRLKELLDYDSKTGIFIWKENRGKARVGMVAGSISVKYNGKKYIRLGIDGINHIFAHHLAWLYMYGYLPPNQIDHINGDGCDNRISNIRLATSSENNKNARRSCLNTSGVTGVSWAKRSNKWNAQIKINHKSYNLGYYINFIDAVIVRKMAEIENNFHPNHGMEREL